VEARRLRIGRNRSRTTGNSGGHAARRDPSATGGLRRHTEGQYLWASSERVLRDRQFASVALGLAIALVPLFGPYRVVLGALVVAVEWGVNHLALRRVRAGGRPTRFVAVTDTAVTIALVAAAPQALAVAAIVLASIAALNVFWFGPRFTLTNAAVAEACLIGLGLRYHPPLWATAVVALAICTASSSAVLHRLADSAEDARRRFDDLVNGIDAALWEAGGSGHLDFVSANIANVVGCSAADFVRPGFIDDRVHPDDRQAWAEARHLNGEGRSTEVHVRVRDGHDVYRRIQERVKVSLNGDGSIHRHRGLLVDETKRWDAEADLRRYSNFIQGIPIALIILRLPDTDSPRSLEVTAMNPAARSLFGVAHDGVPSTRVADLIDIDDKWLGRIADVARMESPFERPFLRIPGAEGIFALRGVPLPDHTIGLSLEDVTKRERLAESFRHQALHDPLTGLPNRSHLHSRLSTALTESARTADPVALLLVDLDQFKEVNDALGHEYGDRLLSELARRLAGNLRQCDTIARLGGDEFAVLLTTGADEAGAQDVATRLLGLCDKPFEVGDFRFQIGASVGIAVAPEHGTDADTLLRRADSAMYRAKAKGGGTAVYSPGQDLYNVRRLELLGDLRDAVRSDDLVVHYQPRIDLRTLRAVGVEALVRWRHPRHGILAPDEFIELAEVSGTIHLLTQQVSERASAEVHPLLDRHNMSMSVNLSARNLYDATLVHWVGDMIDRHDIAWGSLCFEITETQLMDDSSQSLSVLHELRDLGVRFSVDDFGTGYSSLSYLRQLPIDEVKADLRHDDTIVRSVIDLGHNLGLHVVAEGVEDSGTLERLRALGCDSAQGYHLGMPMPAADLAHFLGGPGNQLAGGASVGAWENTITLR
jgi:diguanylate cyclase (GGDEF)-like protein